MIPIGFVSGTSDRLLVAALGNPMAGDDGFGPRVVQALLARRHPRVAVADLSLQSPTALLDRLPWPGGLIIVDAVVIPALAAGQLVDLDWFLDARPQLAHEAALSTHGLSVAAQLDLATALHLLPDGVRLIGAVVASTKAGDKLSPALAAAAGRAVERIELWAERWRRRIAA